MILPLFLTSFVPAVHLIVAGLFITFGIFRKQWNDIFCLYFPEPYLLIMEYVMCGKLLTYLRERRSRPDRFSGSGALTSRDLTVFAYCVARGMDYIASKGVSITTWEVEVVSFEVSELSVCY